MIFDKSTDICFGGIYLNIDSVIHNSIFLKIEGLNIAGSIKLKTAKYLINGLEREYGNLSKKKIIESSSGNLGIALSMICQERGYDFTCVVDPNISEVSSSLIKLYGGKIHRVDTVDANGGYLKSRIDYIRHLMRDNSDYIWTNQYSSSDNIYAHYSTTASELYEEFEKTINYLFIGTGTTGTLSGCVEYFQEKSPATRIIAVEPYGSLTFSDKAAKRLLPGIGTSYKPKIASLKNVHDIVYVSEKQSIQMCHHLVRKHSLIAGASTGSVVAAIKKYSKKMTAKDIVVAISPDLGGKYVSTVYNSTWLAKNNFL